MDERLAAWLTALDERHLANLTHSEAARALRALSSCYVERRAKLARGGALDTAGKRAAFALFYAPLHFLVTREVVRALPDATRHVARIVDVGCGTGSAGAAWAMECGNARVTGVDRHPWAVAEAAWTYRQLGLSGRAARSDAERMTIDGGTGTAILAAYAVNELDGKAREILLPRLVAAHERGARVLVIEPIARRPATWWPVWERRIREAGGRADQWRFQVPLPPTQRALARSAGLNPRELTARTLWI
ncbi:MAG: hypothetical protein A3H96_03600 [Acidobacteria bacterium RIFCSPLOWO2_02_FULL_67_36]|nr:MAG: hypothetical protein A3H96_03600 [Acidobacteria bacterium RIFCSPLOWO2_02_FULL_67_36]OFW22797.1 MAG: hypothetical protein A3G21_26285 [Acidobacteria bacterium RIFCSPLOWO2_12_FULL_66_21]